MSVICKVNTTLQVTFYPTSCQPARGNNHTRIRQVLMSDSGESVDDTSVQLASAQSLYFS